MQPLFLLAAALLQGGGDLASIHPTDVDVYLEVPDAALLAEATRNSPLLDTFRDEAVREFIGAVSGMGDYDLDALIDDAWQHQLPPEPRALLEGLRGASLSLRSNPGALPDFLLAARFDDEATAKGALQAVASQAPSAPLEDPAWTGAIAVEDGLGLGLWSTSVGPHLLLATEGMRDEGLAARVAGGAGGIDTHAKFERADAALGSTDVPTIMHGFFRRSPVTILAELLMGTPGAPAGELGMVADQDLLGGPHRFRMGFQGDRYVTEIFSPRRAPSETPPAMLGTAPVDRSLAAQVPGDLMVAYATTIDGEALAAHAEVGLELIAQQMGDPGLPANLEQQLGFPVQRLLMHLGEQMTVQSQPIQGFGLPETAIWIDLADAEAFAADLAVVAEKLPGLLAGFEANTRDYKVKNADGERVPYPITSLTLPDGLIDVGLPINVQPSVTVANGRLLMGLSSIHVKRELKRLLGDEPPAAGESDPWKQAGFAIPEGARSAVVVDWGRQISGLVSLAKLAGPMLGDGLPFDLSAMPDGAIFVQHFRPTVHFQLVRDEGTYRYHEASFGPEAWLLPLAVLGGVQSTRTMAAPFPGAAVRVERPQESDLANEMALQQVRAAITIFRGDRGALPQSLDDLLSTSDAFPQGYLASGRLPADAWGHPLVYSVGDGGDFELYSIGANGQDEGGAGDDVSLR